MFLFQFETMKPVIGVSYVNCEDARLLTLQSRGIFVFLSRLKIRLEKTIDKYFFTDN